MITVIIPTIGRKTLVRSLNSLLNQHCGDWLALVGIDNVHLDITKLPQDKRITYIQFEKKLGGGSNHGGAVRNALINMATTEWVCFLDDDDTFRPTYISIFIEEKKLNPNANCIIFKMSFEPSDTRRVLPEVDAVKPSNIGISFALDVAFIREKNIYFIPGSLEDFVLVKSLEDARGIIHFSKHIVYNVRF